MDIDLEIGGLEIRELEMEKLKQKKKITGVFRTIILITLIITIGVFLNACQTNVSVKTPLPGKLDKSSFAYPTRKPSVVEGRKTFQQNCATCHGFGGHSKHNFTLKYINSVTPSDLFKKITDDNAHPSFTDVLAVDEKWEAVMYLRYKLFGLPHDMEGIEPEFGSNCAVCHGKRGHADGPLHYFLDPPPANFTEFKRLYEKTDEKLFDEIANGIPWTAMPPWAGRVDKNKNYVFDEKFRWELVKYVRHFAYKTEKDELRDEALLGQKEE